MSCGLSIDIQSACVVLHCYM